MKAKAQCVQKSASTEHTLMTGEPASKVSQRIGWVGDNQDQRLWCHFNDSGNDISINNRIGIKKLQPSGWISAVRGPAGLFIDSRCDDHEDGVSKLGVVASEKFHRRRKGGTILEIGHNTLCALTSPVHHNDLACNSAHDKREKTSGTYASHSDDTHFHD
jgi:hypothetical protein